MKEPEVAPLSSLSLSHSRPLHSHSPPASERASSSRPTSPSPLTAATTATEITAATPKIAATTATTAPTPQTTPAPHPNSNSILSAHSVLVPPDLPEAGNPPSTQLDQPSPSPVPVAAAANDTSRPATAPTAPTAPIPPAQAPAQDQAQALPGNQPEDQAHAGSSGATPTAMTVSESQAPIGRSARSSLKRTSQKRRPALPVTSATAPVGQLPLSTTIITPDLWSSSLDSHGSSRQSTLCTTTTVTELASLVKSQSYHSQKYHQTKQRIRKSLISNGISARLTRTVDLCHRILVDHFKSDQKADFAVLYNAIHDVRNSCEASRRFAGLETEVNSSSNSGSGKNGDCNSTGEGQRQQDSQAGVGSGISFLHDLPPQARETILDFIANIRAKPDFLASRLARLSNHELDHLSRFHYQPNHQESILPQQATRRSGTGSLRGMHTPSGSGTPGNIPTPLERLLAFHRNDHLYTLLHTIFANSTGPDSAEDQRKLEIWANVCARLISENKGEGFLMCIMDSFAAMREWPAKGNLEICVMNLVQEGAFLVERGDETTGGSTTKAGPDLKGKYDLLAEEFWTKAERTLFEVLDDEPGAGGIPEGILELGHAILERIEDPKRQRQAEIIIVVKWFFNRFLANGVAYPEYHGIMTGHHISEHARLKILRPVLKKMYNHAVSVIFGDWKTNSPVEPVIRTHIENLLSRFRCPRPINTPPVLVSTKTVTSPPETPEVQPFIVLCPADIVTLYQAVYPSSTTQLDPRDITKKLGSGTGSIGRASSRMFTKSPGEFGIGSSVFSDAGSSSVTSETASITAPLLDRGSFQDDRRSFMSIPSPAPSSTFNMAPPSLVGTETPLTVPDKSGSAEVRAAVEAMRGRLGYEATSGACHPCAEKWAVIYISEDGQQLGLNMRTEWEEDEEDDDEEQDGEESEDEHHEPAELSGLDRDYDQLKAAVLKLVDEYEIPEEPESEEEEAPKEQRPILRQSISAPVPATSTAPVPASDSPPGPELDPSNPFHQSNLTAMLLKSQQNTPKPTPPPAAIIKPPSPPSGMLLTMLQAAYTQCYARDDFVSANLYWRALIQLRRLPASLQANEFSSLISIFSLSARRSIDKLAAALDEYEHWFIWSSEADERLDTAIGQLMKRNKELRDKMWYVTDVRNSAAYDEARNVALALKKMGTPPAASTKPQTPKTGRAQLSHRMSTSSFSLLKSDTLIDILAAPTVHGGPNKLSDEQAAMTSEYLSKYSVENFCKGEERIHRFCLEVDKCVTKLVGDGILDGPVLWSSELYSRDEREMSINRQKGDLYLSGIGTLSVADEDHPDDYPSHRSGSSSTAGSSAKRMDMLRRPSTSDLFGRNRSASLITSVSSSSTAARAGKMGINTSAGGLMDSIDRQAQDFLGGMSPTLGSGSDNGHGSGGGTFWSPFSAGSHSSHGTLTGKPKTSHSPTTLLKTQEMIEEEKRRFLAELKQSLTGLLLSDLGLEVFSRGSETDGWFATAIVEDCIQRKDEQEEIKRREEAKKKKGAKKVQRKKSMKGMVRKDKSGGGFEPMNKERKGELAAPVATFETVSREAREAKEAREARESRDKEAREAKETKEPRESREIREAAAHFSADEFSSSSDVPGLGRSSNYSTLTKKTTLGKSLGFPYTHAFRRLLLKFSTHPNPFQKLTALYELERLIVASLSRHPAASATKLPKPSLPSLPASPFLGAPGGDASRISSLQLQQPSNIEEAIANLEERRSNVLNTRGASASATAAPPAGSGAGSGAAAGSGAGSGAGGYSSSSAAPSTDMIVDVLQSLFRQSDIRPATLFRDLQFVAAFVPASILDMTEVGKAFWDTGLAALGLKMDVCRTMVEIADEVVTANTARGNHGSSESTKSKSKTKSNQEKVAEELGLSGTPESSILQRYSMQDAANMWAITAREGDPTAQRELAILYLTDPSLLPRTTKPLSRPRDTFRADMMAAKGEDPEKRDPATMCVAYHWMELSAQGGDELARRYLRTQEEWY